MQEPSDTTSYRISLALVLAFFFHTLVVLAVAQWPFPASEDEPRTVRVQLVHPGKSPTDSAESVPDTPGEEVREEQRPPSEPETAPDPIVTAEESQRTVPDPFQDEADRPRRPQSPTRPTEFGEAPGTPSDQAIRQIFGADSPHAGDEDASVTQLSTEDAPQLSDYELALWQQIAGEVRYSPILDELDQPHSVILELRLMRNGALRGVRVTEGSAIDDLDQLAREAALRASPYPEPPDAERDAGLRFRVELRFTPGAG